ncbi:MAG: hypothetical protein U0V48_11970 [Anaerolineales bacterium]
MTVFGLGAPFYVVIISFMAGSIPGFPFLASIIALFSGAQLFAPGNFSANISRACSTAVWIVPRTLFKKRRANECGHLAAIVHSVR